MNEAKTKAVQFVNLVRKQGIPVQQAYLFGSQAKGTATADSDIDVCVISNSFKVADYLSEMVRLRKISLLIDSRIEPIAFRPGDLDDKFSPIATEVKKFGQPLL